MAWAMCLFIGLCSGFLAGLLGVGGGTVIVPALILAANWLGIGTDDATPVAMATALAIVIPTSISSAKAHAVRGSIDWHAFRDLAPGAAAGALAGTLAASVVGGRLALAAFVGFALFAARRLLAAAAPGSEASPTPQSSGAVSNPRALRPHSLAIGLVSGLAGVGGGLLSVPLLARYMPMRRAIGTAAALGLPLAIAGLTGYAVAGHSAQCATGCVGYVFLPAVAVVSLASIATAPLGASLAHHLPVRLLRRAFATLLLVVSADLLTEVFR
jgi:uncharacterized protein